MSKHFSSPSEARGIISLKATTEGQQWQINSEDSVEATMSNKQNASSSSEADLKALWIANGMLRLPWSKVSW